MAKNLELSLKKYWFFKEGEISEMKVIKDIINNKLWKYGKTFLEMCELLKVT